MAFIYVALDKKLARKVAIKVLHEHMEKNPGTSRSPLPVYFNHEMDSVFRCGVGVA